MEVWATALQRASFRTVAALQGAEAFQLMRSVVPDLMILDLRMPELGGTAVPELVRTRPILARIPVLIIWSLTSQQRVLKSGGRLVRHARSFVLQFAEGHLTRRLFGQNLWRNERLAWHPT